MAKELPMNVNRIVKWSAAALLAVASVPAVGLGRSMRASLPMDVISMTPTGSSSPLAATPVSATSTHKSSARHKTSHHKRTSTHHRKGAARHHKHAAHHGRHKSAKSSKHA